MRERSESVWVFAVNRALYVVLVLAASAAAARADGRDPVLESFRLQLEMEKRLLASDAASLERVQEQLREATERMVRLGDDLLRAQKDGEESASLIARAADVRKSEVEVVDLVAQAQQLRATMASRRDLIEQVAMEIRRMEEGAAGAQDELSGRWAVSIEPGALKGTFDLRLDGSVVTGVYQLSGGWRGSLRGTLIGGNVRLERIDAQLGFVATYSGRLVTRGTDKRIEGTWEATNLAGGMPVSGTWVGQREAKP